MGMFRTFRTFRKPSKVFLVPFLTTTSMVVKNGTKKTFEGFLNVLNVLNMSHGNGSSTLVFQVMGILKPVTVSTDEGLQLSHSPMVGCNSLYGSNFDFRMTYLDSRHSRQNYATLDANYSINHNSKVLI